MIKVGIAGAETLMAGELVRVLINHPDVALKTLASIECAGRDVSDVHVGLVGDINLVIERTLPAHGHDVVFLCGEPWMARTWMSENVEELKKGDIKIIDLTGAYRYGDHQMVYGLCEANRKALVRGANMTSVPGTVAQAVEVALFPLAKNMLTVGNIGVHVQLPQTLDCQTKEKGAHPGSLWSGVAESTRLDPIAPIENRPDNELAVKEIENFLRKVQPSFSGSVKLTLSSDTNTKRGVTCTISMPCTVALEEIRRIYREAYDDHNFSYLIDRKPTVADVANTNKCLIDVAYTRNITGDECLTITSVIDGLLKGGAGNAVHCMNLLFGLSERTGLALKASGF